MDKPTLADVDAGGRWINDEIAQLYAQWEKIRDDILMKYADLPSEIEANRLAALKRDHTERERIENMNQELRPVYYQMAKLKTEFWLPIVRL